MTSDRRNNFAKMRAPGRILVDEDHVDDVMATVTSPEFPPLPSVYHDDPDLAGLVAVHWHDHDRDPADVVNRIRELAPHLQDVVSPDHTVGIVVRPDDGREAGTSVEMGGPAKPPIKTDDHFQPRREDDLNGQGVVVGVIDSGIVGHPWLDGSFLATPGSIDPLDEDHDRWLDPQAGHGVFVAGLILREAPAAQIRMVRAFDRDGVVRIRAAANAIVKLDRAGADIINLSFGGYTRGDKPPLAHRKALSKIRDTTVVVAAAGNHDPEDPAQAVKLDRPFWPGAMERVVAVAALDTLGKTSPKLAPFSNVGDWVDVAAPGTNVLSTYVTFRGFEGWAQWSGTSFAAPVVTGRIAAAMTDESGVRTRTAQEAKEKVLDDAAVKRLPGLGADVGGVAHVILPGAAPRPDDFD